MFSWCGNLNIFVVALLPYMFFLHAGLGLSVFSNMETHMRHAWSITTQFLKEANGFRWGERGWQVLVRGLATEEEKACAQEKLPISKSIVQFHHLSWDILGSGWISGEIRIGKVFFPSYCEGLKPQDLYQILLLLFLYAPKLTIYFIWEGHVRCWSYGLVVHLYCAFVGLDQVRLSALVFRCCNKAGTLALCLPFDWCTSQWFLRLKWKLKHLTFEATQSGVLTAVLIDMLSSIPAEPEAL